MIVLKTKEEIAKMREAGVLLAQCHKEIEAMIKPGVATWEIEQFVERFLAENGATPEQKGYHGFKYATCASVNEVMCHGFPDKNPLKDGDVVTIDMVVNLNGWLADSAWSYRVGNVSEKADALLKVTEESLYLGIEKAVIGNRLGDVSNVIQKYAESKGYAVVRDFTGHGIGQKMHEEPQVLHYGPAGKGVRLKEGMVFTIEPILTTGSHRMKIDSDGWTARTVDGSLSAQYEHTIAITEDGPVILTKL